MTKPKKKKGCGCLKVHMEERKKWEAAKVTLQEELLKKENYIAYMIEERNGLRDVLLSIILVYDAAEVIVKHFLKKK